MNKCSLYLWKKSLNKNKTKDHVDRILCCPKPIIDLAWPNGLQAAEHGKSVFNQNNKEVVYVFERIAVKLICILVPSTPRSG